MSDNVLLLLTIGLFAGVMSGLFGIGGGIIIVPALILLAGFTQLGANGTSLVALLLPVGILAVLTYYRNKLVDVRAAMLIALGIALGVFGGAQLALGLSPEVLKVLYALFMFYIGWRYLEPRKLWSARQARLNHPDAPKLPKAEPMPPAIPQIGWGYVLLVGLIAGVFSGLFGIGGGVVIVPILVSFMHYDQKLAVGTSLGALLLPVGLPGVISYYAAGALNFGAAVPVAVGLVIGALGGANLAIGLPSATVKRMYGAFLLIVATYFVLTSLPALLAALEDLLGVKGIS